MHNRQQRRVFYRNTGKGGDSHRGIHFLRKLTGAEGPFIV